MSVKLYYNIIIICRKENNVNNKKKESPEPIPGDSFRIVLTDLFGCQCFPSLRNQLREFRFIGESFKETRLAPRESSEFA